MKIDYRKRRPLIWRLIPIFSCLIWIFHYFVWAFIFYEKPTHELLILFPYNRYIELGFAFFVLAVLLIFPYQYYLQAAVFWLWGLVRVLDGGTTDVIIIHIICFTLLYRQGFFMSKLRIKVFVIIIMLLIAIISQMLLLGITVFLENTLEALVFGLVVAITIYLLRNEWQFQHEEHKAMSLLLPSKTFTEKDVSILEKILSGKKYDTIAIETGLAVSTLKKHIRHLFRMLQVSDRTSFMSLYAKHKVILASSDKA